VRKVPPADLQSVKNFGLQKINFETTKNKKVQNFHTFTKVRTVD
jgi:hypothetical protein